MDQFKTRLVLITGAASGLGRLLAKRFAGNGARCVLWDLDGEGLARVAAEIGGDVQTQVVDVADHRAVASAAEGLEVDILINNAGVVTGRPLLECSPEQVQRTFAVNTLALFWTTQAILPGMIARGRGHIVTIASASGLVGAAKLVDYASSKHAAVGFDESLRLELRRQGHDIDTTVICPYFIDTGMFAGAKSRFSWLLPILDPEMVADRIMSAIRWKRRRVLIPPLVFIVFLARYLPVTWFDAFAEFLGLTHAMDDFHGRP